MNTTANVSTGLQSLSLSQRLIAGALAAAMKVASEIDSGVIVFIVCDRGDRYLSSDLFD